MGIEDDILGLGKKRDQPKKMSSPAGKAKSASDNRGSGFDSKAFFGELAKKSAQMKANAHENKGPTPQKGPAQGVKTPSRFQPPARPVVAPPQKNPPVEQTSIIQAQGPLGKAEFMASIQTLAQRSRERGIEAPHIQGGQGRCQKCDSLGYVVEKNGDWARARLCNCRPTCETCGGKGHIFRREKSYEYMEPCPQCAGLKERVALFNYARVPALFADKFLDVFEPRESVGEAWQYLLKYCRSFPNDTRGVLLVGPPGLGKTHLMVGVVRKLTLEKGVRCMFKDFFLLLSEVKEAYETGRFQSDIMRPLGDVDVLVVDELGKGRNTEWELNLLDEIVCKRYNRNKTTLFTTNFPLVGAPEAKTRSGRGNLSRGQEGTPSLAARVSDRVMSRLQEMCTVLEVNGSDYRAITGSQLSRQRGRRG